MGLPYGQRYGSVDEGIEKTWDGKVKMDWCK